MRWTTSEMGQKEFCLPGQVTATFADHLRHRSRDHRKDRPDNSNAEERLSAGFPFRLPGVWTRPHCGGMTAAKLRVLNHPVPEQCRQNQNQSARWRIAAAVQFSYAEC